MKEKPSLPQVDLFTDKRRASITAKKLLEKNGITYSEWVAGKDYIPETGFVPPILNSRAGQYRGIEGIRDYIIVNSLGK